MKNERVAVLDSGFEFGRPGRVAEEIQPSAFSPDEGGASPSQNGKGETNFRADADVKVNLPFPIHDSLSMDEAAEQLIKLEK